MAEQGDIVRAHCNACAGNRKHHVIFSYENKWTDELSDDPPACMYGTDVFELLECAGCESVRLRHTSTFSEVTDDNGKPVPTITYYPPATFRRQPTWLYGIQFTGPTGDFTSIVFPPEFLPRLLEEIYTALHGECLSLAAMGVRALLERVMVDCVEDQGSFTKNLAAFEAKGYIASRQKDILQTTLEVGHASIHRNYTPTRGDLIHALDITENIIQMIYVGSEQAAEIKKRIPLRKKGPNQSL